MTTTEITTFKREMTLGNPGNLELVLDDDRAVEMIATAFPAEIDAQRRRDKTRALVREAIIHITNSEASDKLCRCTGASVLDSIVSCARLDLSLTKALGQAYLVPFKGVCTLMPGFRGFIKLLVDTGNIKHIETVCVYQGDEFEFYRDEKGPHLRHVPDMESQGSKDKFRLVYLTARTKDNETMVEVMNRAEIDKVRKASKRANDGPWAYYYTEMARKSVIRRFEKSVGKSSNTAADRRLTEALELDNAQHDPSKLAEYKAMSDEHSRSLKDRAMAPVAGAAAPSTDNGPETPPEPTYAATWHKWWALAQAAAEKDPDGWPDLKKNAAHWFKRYVESVLGEDVPDPSKLQLASLAAIVADLDENADPRPFDQRE